MPFTPTEGEVAILTVTMTGGTLSTLPGINWKLALDANTKDVSNFRDGRKRKGTMNDAVITVSLVWDAGEQQTKVAATGLRLGVTGICKCYTDATHFFSVPIIVGAMEPENEGVEGVVMMGITLEANGAITYPVDP